MKSDVEKVCLKITEFAKPTTNEIVFNFCKQIKKWMVDK